jgi:predicted TIM-barrel fold metal-dependent hydrolase
VPILDAHTHIFPSEEAGRKAMRDVTPTGYWGASRDLLALMEKAGITGAVVVGTLPIRNMIIAAEQRLATDPSSDTADRARAELSTKMEQRLDRLNRFLCTESAAHPQFIPFVAANPWLDPDRMLALLEEARALGARGLKLHPPLCRFYPMDERLAPVYSWAQQKGLPVLFHGGRSPESPDTHFSHPRHFEPLAAAYPRLRIIVAHLGWDFFDDAIMVSRRCERVYFDTSFAMSAASSPAILDDAEAVDLIRKIGVHKTVFASDYPWSNPVEDLERIRSIGLTEAELERILWNNGQEVLNA